MKNIEFNDAFMGAGEPLKGSVFPGFGAGNRNAGTSRVERRRPKQKRVTKPVPKGLSRSAVVVVRLTPREYEVRVKGTRELVGVIKKIMGPGGSGYSFQRKNDVKAHKGFASQKAAVARMLEKC